MEDPGNSKMDGDRPSPRWWAIQRFRLSHLANLFGLVGLPLSIVFFVASIREPNVTFTVYPIRVAVVRSGISSDLSVLYKGSELKKNVTSVAIQIWNAGKATVDQSSVLEPLQLSMPQGNRILESHVIRQSRPVVQFEVKQVPDKPSSLALSFRILERNDGAVLQLMYEGDPNADVTIDGLLRGQPELAQLDYERLHNLLGSTRSQDIASRGETELVILICIVAAGFFGFLGRYTFQRRNEPVVLAKAAPTMHVMFWIFAAAFLITGLFAAYLVFFVRPPLSFAA